jgi:hypothetical protein
VDLVDFGRKFLIRKYLIFKAPHETPRDGNPGAPQRARRGELLKAVGN